MSIYVWSAIGVGVLAVIGAAVSCTSETSGGTSSTEAASSSSASSGASSSSGSAAGGGSAASTTGSAGGGQGGAGGQGQGGSGGAGGSHAYMSCSDCVNDMTGAPANECNAAHDACFAIKECVGIYNCVYFGSPPCTNDQAGACCTIACFKATAAPQSAIDLYKAMDSCIYCNTCRSLCSTDDYCAVFEQPGGDAVCGP